MSFNSITDEYCAFDLKESEPSSDSEDSQISSTSAESQSDISESVANPGQYDEENPPLIEKGKLYKVIIGHWVVPGSGPLEVQNVVYPYVDKKGAISYRIQPEDQQGNEKPIPQRGWRVSENDLQIRNKAANNGSYFQFDATMTQAVDGNPVPVPRERVRDLIQRTSHGEAVERFRDQRDIHNERRSRHAPTKKYGPFRNLDLLHAMYRRLLIRQEVRKATRQAERRAARRADRRIARVKDINRRRNQNQMEKWLKNPPDRSDERVVTYED